MRQIINPKNQREDVGCEKPLASNKHGGDAGDAFTRCLEKLQECPEARTAFKYLALDGSCDVIGSRSLLVIRYKSFENAPLLPVGYERQAITRSLGPCKAATSTAHEQ